MVTEFPLVFTGTEITLVGIMPDDRRQLLIVDQAGERVATILPTNTNVITVSTPDGHNAPVSVQQP